MLIRPNKDPASVLTVTQFAHEWANHLEEQGWDIADGGRGRPSFPADKDAVEAMYRFTTKLRDNNYVALYGTSVIGEQKYRDKVVRGFKSEYGIEFNPEEIMFTPGGQFGLAAIFNMIEKMSPGGKIVTPSPWYVNHEILSSLYHQGGSKLHPIDILSTPGHKITKDALQNSLNTLHSPLNSNLNPLNGPQNPPIAAFLFCIPGNPLGNIMHKNDWLELIPTLKKFNVPIVLDEAFAEIVFDHNFETSLLHAAPELADRIIIMRSGTKALGLSGERLAVQRIPLKYMPYLIEFQSRLIGNCPLIVQSGMSAAMENMTADKKNAISDYYKNNADYLLAECAKLGLKTTTSKPAGGFYFLVNLSKLLGAKMPSAAMAAYSTTKQVIENDIDISMALMFGYNQNPQTGVATVPASAFGIPATNGWVRISFSNHLKVLEKIAAALKAATA